MVKQFIKQTKFHTDYFYLVLTYGKIHGGAAELANQFLKECGIEADYINTIMMVDNYLPVFDMNEQIELDPKKKVDEHIAAIREDIEARKHWKQEATLTDRMFHQGYLKMSRKNPIDIKGVIFKVCLMFFGFGNRHAEVEGKK